MATSERAGKAILASLLLVGGLGATEVRFFAQNSRDAFLEGSLEGVSVDETGALRLAPGVARVGAIDEPFVFAAASHPEGWVLGTGNSGRVLLVGDDGSVRTLLTAAEPIVVALRVEPDGTVFAGSSPRGKVYRIDPDGRAEVFFDPGETYIWAFERTAAGELLVATGTEGRLFAVDGEGHGRVLYDAEEPHRRCLRAAAGGTVLLGTAGEGLVLRLDGDGRVRTLFDATQPEVVALAAAPDGRAWAALVDSEASLRGAASEVEGGEEADEEEEEEVGESRGSATVSVTVEEGAAPTSRGPRSEVVRISPEGLVETLHRFADETVYDLTLADDRLWVATGLEGKVFSLLDGKVLLEQDLEPRQVIGILPGPEGPAFATTNAAGLYRSLAATVRRGVYTSAPLDAGAVADFGTLRWLGELPSGARVTLAARSGMSRQPDRTWAEWTSGEDGNEAALDGLAAGRWVQWRAELEAGAGPGPVVSAVELAYRQKNLPARVTELAALDPGQVLVPSSFDPGSQVYELAEPARDGIFTSVVPAAESNGGRWKTLWRYGFRTLRWQVEDPNDDELEASLEFRPEAGAEWFPMADSLEENHYSFDATALPDGLYRFRLRVSDEASNRDGGAQIGERVSGPIVIDHSPPRLLRSRRDRGAVEVELEDALNPLRRVEVSLDAGDWRVLAPVDGLLDGRRETLRVELPNDPPGIVLLRVMDASFNAATFDLATAAP